MATFSIYLRRKNANPETPPAILQIEAVFDFQSLGLLSDNELVPNIKSRVFFSLLSCASTCSIGLGLKKRVERRPTFGSEFIVSLTHLKNKEKSRKQTNYSIKQCPSERTTLRSVNSHGCSEKRTQPQGTEQEAFLFVLLFAVVFLFLEANLQYF